jgi:hypothetical protein
MKVSEMFIKPRRFKIIDTDDIDYYISIYNGKKDLYQTVYNYEDVIDINTVIVDKIFLDFDYNSDMKFLSDVRGVAKYLYRNDYLFYIRFSGNGFHIFILLDDDELKNPKSAIKNYVDFLHKQTGTTSDPAVIGDLRRVVRIPNTLNIKHKEQQYYCIPISYNELINKTYEEIKLLASYPRETKDDFINGHRLLNISEWDSNILIKEHHNAQNIISDVEISDEIPPCIKELMKDPMLGNTGRIQVILFFRDLGYTRDEVEDLLYSFLSEEKFNHCVHEEHLIDYLFEKNYIFNDCIVQKENGFCTDETCKGHGLYY